MTRKIRGIRDAIPAGYMLARVGTGSGDVGLVRLSDVASKAYVQQVAGFPSINDGFLIGNESGGAAVPVGVSLTSLLDYVFGNPSAQGAILYRDSGAWKVLAPGTAGNVLSTGGATANPSWIAASGATYANPTATAGATAINGTATTAMRSDAAPAIIKGSNTVFGIVKVDGTSITASGGVISAAATGANPTGTASDTVVNGSATTFMRSDGAPAIQTATSSQFGLVKVDGVTITQVGGVIRSASGGTGGYPSGTLPPLIQVAHSAAGGQSVVFATAPTNKSLLVAMCSNPSTQTAGTGWAVVVVNTGGTDFGTILTKTAGASESATQTPLGGTNPSSGGIMIWEIGATAGITPTFVGGATQNEFSGAANSAVLMPNSTNCMGLATVISVAAASVPTITNTLNVGTLDVLDTSNATRKLVAGHTDLSQTPMAGILIALSASGSSKSFTALVTQ